MRNHRILLALVLVLLVVAAVHAKGRSGSSTLSDQTINPTPVCRVWVARSPTDCTALEAASGVRYATVATVDGRLLCVPVTLKRG